MILESLTLHNFRSYGGKHTLRFAPPSTRRPITLIGALNGAGKTSILDALQLTLYGKLSACVGVQDQGGYDEFLRRSIHRGVSPRDGAALELEFLHERAGRTHRYRVRRSWYVRASGAREAVQVHVDGELDHGLSHDWGNHAESVLPSGLAPLFLFDGEKIEQLANPSNSSAILRSAIHGLLGLDIVDKLTSDLLVVERRQHARHRDDPAIAALEDWRDKREQAQERSSEANDARAEMRTRRDGLRTSLQKAEEFFKSQGGDAYLEQSEVEQQLALVEAERVSVESELLSVAAGSLPLSIVPELCEAVLAQSEVEETSRRALMLQEELENRDTALLEFLSSSGESTGLRASIEAFLEGDRAERARQGTAESYLALPSEGRSRLEVLLGQGMGEEIKRAQALLRRLEKLEVQLEELEARRAKIPDRDAIRDAQSELHRCQAELKACEDELAKREREAEHLSRALNHVIARVQTAERRARAAATAQDASRRVADYCGKGRSTLDQFRAALLERNCERIAGLVHESFVSLHRKKGLITGIEISPGSFDVLLKSKNDLPLDPSELSAGERQLLATAFLWGLARASGRELPTVIDTPLGRLDSEHRAHLVSRYFPKASKQVVLLSTDEEIAGRHYEGLASRVGQHYQVVYDEAVGASRIEEGYFDQ